MKNQQGLTHHFLTPTLRRKMSSQRHFGRPGEGSAVTIPDDLFPDTEQPVLPLDTDRLYYLGGTTEEPDGIPSPPHGPPILLPVPATLWAGAWTPPIPVLIAHPGGRAWLPMWGLDAPDERGYMHLTADGELQQSRTQTRDRAYPLRAWWAALDTVWVLTVENSDLVPEVVDPEPPTAPRPRRLSTVLDQAGSLLGRTAWCKAVGGGWVSRIIVSEMYDEEMDLATQAAWGLSGDDDAIGTYVQIMDPVDYLNWQLSGIAGDTKRYLAAHLWL